MLLAPVDPLAAVPLLPEELVLAAVVTTTPVPEPADEICDEFWAAIDEKMADWDAAMPVPLTESAVVLAAAVVMAEPLLMALVTIGLR